MRYVSGEVLVRFEVDLGAEDGSPCAARAVALAAVIAALDERSHIIQREFAGQTVFTIRTRADAKDVKVEGWGSAAVES